MCYSGVTGYLADFEQMCQELLTRYTYVIVMGGVNIDLLGKSTYNKTYLTTMLDSCDMKILLLQPTHQIDTWLDVIPVTDLSSHLIPCPKAI